MPRWARRLTPETGNVQRGVLVAVMVRATFATRPSPDRKPNSTLRTAEAAADRTTLRGIGFINLGVGYPCVIAFVSEVVAQHRPSRVENALRHSGLCHCRSRHIADRDLAGSIYERPRELVEAVLSPVGDLGVDRPYLPLALLALRLRKLRLEISIEPSLLKLRPVLALRHGFQPKIDADLSPTLALTALDLADILP